MSSTADVSQMSRAWWSSTIETFLAQNPDTIINQLSFRAIQTHDVNREPQLRAWFWEIEILQKALLGLPSHWRILLEYPLIRLGRIIDTVLVTDRAIIVIEFKAFDSRLGADARIQAEDYAFDLRDFHSGCRDCVIVPILVAGAGKPARHQWSFPWPGVVNVYDSLPEMLPGLLKDILGRIPHRDIDIEAWERAEYRPVPNIIEAARAIYAKHGVGDIRSARADTDNLGLTTQAILQAIRDAREHRQHIILFVTGIPGAGKTLCGLNAVFSSETDGTFLTGTLPMVYVLKAALAEDAKALNAGTVRATQQGTKSKIESITGFLRYYILEKDHLPEHVIVFDEAQRAWDAEYGAKSKFKLPSSEAAIVLDIMQRHSDYAVIVALVGNGQEINSGEAGLAEWGKALTLRPNWKIIAAPGVINALEPRQCLFTVAPNGLTVNPALHLSVPIRNVRSSTAAPWVDAVLRGNSLEAQRIATKHLPFFLTRSLKKMRGALKASARGERRSGLVCSSGAKRLVAEGLWPKFEHMKVDIVANWFLKRWPDVRASDALEIPATEYACQGLELDFVGLCWGGDLTWAGHWVVKNFKGDTWQKRQKKDQIDFQINTYRVLLTRARADTIIWVPEGDPNDRTRPPAEFDRTANYLIACGARLLPDFTSPAAVPENPILDLFREK